ncbi:MAG: hypothetical protein WC289_06355 [Patescibacteria group bacterium]|jgi:hypothetical protein
MPVQQDSGGYCPTCHDHVRIDPKTGIPDCGHVISSGDRSVGQTAEDYADIMVGADRFHD